MFSVDLSKAIYETNHVQPFHALLQSGLKREYRQNYKIMACKFDCVCQMERYSVRAR